MSGPQEHAGIYESGVVESKEDSGTRRETAAAPVPRPRRTVTPRTTAKIPKKPKLTIISRLPQGAQGGNSTVYDGTINFKPVIVKQVLISNEFNKQLLKNEILISQKLKDRLNACDDESSLICFQGYMVPRTFDIMSGLPPPLFYTDEVSGIPLEITNQTLFLIYKKIQGKELLTIVQDGELDAQPIEVKYRIATKIIRAIKTIHEIGIIHLDLKLDNIMIDRNFNPTIIDMGYACSYREGQPYTCQVDSIRGTRSFMPPEAFFGQQTNLDILQKQDIYALAVVLFFLLRDPDYASFAVGPKWPLESPSDLARDQISRWYATSFTTLIRNRQLKVPADSIPNSAIEALLNLMIDPNPMSRPSIYDVLRIWKMAINNTEPEVGKIRLAFIRHAVSCSNSLHQKDEIFGYADALNDIAKEIKDTPLSDQGVEKATEYGRLLQPLLEERGLINASTKYASSSLLRAQHTLKLLFNPDHPYIVPHIRETGNIPENTPNSREEQREILGTERIAEDLTPDIKESGWTSFLPWLKTNLPTFTDAQGNCNLVIVGHGTYLRDLYTTLTGSRNLTLNNMDCFIIESAIPTPEKNFKFRVTGDIIRAPVLSPENVEDNKCSLGGTDYRPFPISPDSNIFQYKEALDTLYSQFLTFVGIPSSLNPLAIQKKMDEMVFLYDELGNINDSVNVRAIFIKLYNIVPTMTEWPPVGYTGPPLHTIHGYEVESVQHFRERILTSLGERASDTNKLQIAGHVRNLTKEEVFNYIKTQDTSESIKTLVGSQESSDAILKQLVRTNELDGTIILANIDASFSRFRDNLIATKNYNDYIYITVTPYPTERTPSNFYSSELQASVFKQKLQDPMQQFFTVIPRREKLKNLVSGNFLKKSVIDGKNEYLRGLILEEREEATREDRDDTEKPFHYNYSETAWLQFRYKLYSVKEDDTVRVGIIQGFKLAEYPDVAAALFMGPPLAMSAHAERLLGDAWATSESTRAWVLEHSQLTEAEFRGRYGTILADYERQDRQREELAPSVLKLNRLEAMTRINPGAACAEILEGATDAVLANVGRLLANKVKKGLLQNTCPTPEEFQSALYRTRVFYNIKNMDMTDNLAAIRDLVESRLEPELVYTEFKEWLRVYNATKRTYNTNLFIPEVIEIGRKLTGVGVRPVSQTETWWKKEFIANLNKIIALLKEQLPAKVEKVKANNTTIQIIAEAPYTPVAREAALKLAFQAPRNPTSTDQAVMNLPFNLDVIANLNEIDPALAYQEVMNAPFQDKYITHPNPAGIAVSDQLKQGYTKAGFFTSAVYPDISGTLAHVRDEFGLPPDLKRHNPQRILKFAKSTRSTAAAIFKKIENWRRGHPEFLPSIQKGFLGRPPNKSVMVSALDNFVESTGTATSNPIIRSRDFRGYEAVRPSVGPSLPIEVDPLGRIEDLRRPPPRPPALEARFAAARLAAATKPQASGAAVNPAVAAGQRATAMYPSDLPPYPADITERLDTLEDLAAIDPQKACKEIVDHEQQQPDYNLKNSLRITRKKGFFSDTITCQPQKELLSKLAAYREQQGIRSNWNKMGQRLLALINNPKAKDEIIYMKLTAFKQLYDRENEVDPILTRDSALGPLPPIVDGRFFGKTYPTRQILRTYVEQAIGNLSHRGPARQRGGSVAKLPLFTRKMPRRQQKGGGVTAPLGFYQEGAQMQGTSSYETGVGLAGMTENMARAALIQTGGQQKQRQRQQQGGFTPSVMGSFAANGLSLLPVASYMGYRMMKKSKTSKTRKGKAARTGRKRQTRRT